MRNTMQEFKRAWANAPTWEQTFYVAQLAFACAVVIAISFFNVAGH